MSPFKFELGQRVKLKLTSESGEIVSRAEHQDCTQNYLVRYIAADGRQVENWHWESALVEAD